MGQGDRVPDAPATVAVSMADKMDTLVQFFGIDERPTGSRDPFALRRAALGVIRLITENGLRLSLRLMIREALMAKYALIMEKAKENRGKPGAIERRKEDLEQRLRQREQGVEPPPIGPKQVGPTALTANAKPSPEQAIMDFFADRLKVQQREAGVRHDLIDAVFAFGNEDDLVRLLNRVKALQNFVQTEDGEHLLTAYKRAANILKKEDWHGVAGEIAKTGEEDPLAGVDDPDLAPVIAAKMAERHEKELSYTPEPAEKDLIEALDSAEPKAAAAVEAEDFEAAMAALASLRAPIDRFFDEVTVNDDDPSKRSSRLDLLARFRAAVHEVADFSRIEG
jgi:glycyl-tRNA synthetase beta chain